MSKLALAHPEEGTLLQYLDGEVGRREAREIHDHLEACWQCRTALEELQVTVNDCVRYRKQVLIPSMPEPPAAWGSLGRWPICSSCAAGVASRPCSCCTPTGSPSA